MFVATISSTARLTAIIVQSQCMGPSVGLTLGAQAHTTHSATKTTSREKLIKMLKVTQFRDKSVSEDLTRELDCKLAELHHH